jgi:hypothetical protein
MSADVLRDLARAKVAFQLRAVSLVLGLRDSDRLPEGEDPAKTGAECEASQSGRSDSEGIAQPNPGVPHD